MFTLCTIYRSTLCAPPISRDATQNIAVPFAVIATPFADPENGEDAIHIVRMQDPGSSPGPSKGPTSGHGSGKGLDNSNDTQANPVRCVCYVLYIQLYAMPCCAVLYYTVIYYAMGVAHFCDMGGRRKADLSPSLMCRDAVHLSLTALETDYLPLIRCISGEGEGPLTLTFLF